MKAGEAIAEILRREGVEIIFGYPVNHVLEFAARAGIRPIIVRQERIGLHMADAMSRLTSGQKIGVFAMQHGPGAENAFGGIAQAYGEAVPVLVLPMGYPRALAYVEPNFNSVLNMRHVTKSAEPIILTAELPAVFRRAFTRLKSGRGGPVLVEIPRDVFDEEVAEPLAYTPATLPRVGPDPDAVRAVARRLLEARRPVIYAGQGVHYARAWAELRRLAELLGAPVTTSLGGKSAFPENHKLALGSGGNAIPAPVHHFLHNADLIFGIGCSFTKTNFGVDMPAGKAIIHATLDPMDLNKDVVCEQALIGDARLVLEALLNELQSAIPSPRDPAPVADEIKAVREPWLAEWRPKLTSDEVPLNPYRVLWDLAHTVDLDNTIVTHDSGSPREQLLPFWEAHGPRSYLGFGKSTQLGQGLGLIMGAKLAAPEKLCINVMGDAAIGMVGMDIETAARDDIAILTVVFNNGVMAAERKSIPLATKKFGALTVSGNYAPMADALGVKGYRVETTEEIIPQLEKAIATTEAGRPALLEVMVKEGYDFSQY
jgi:thiamine pyrophosphate-dependent acetolactate synthase large subunit-like protein